jgi:hypothetical protein
VPKRVVADLVREVRCDRGFAAVEDAVRLDITQGPVKKVLRHLERSIAIEIK